MILLLAKLKMNKSFFYGIIAASVTWAISLYLFWTLTTNPSLQNGLTNSPAVAKSLNPQFENVVLKKSNVVAPNQLLLDKYEHLKKEKEHRKISQKLKDELKPVKPQGLIGKDFIMQYHFQNPFMFLL
jgi:polypeptide N-acetylgalactosaminyltransferase